MCHSRRHVAAGSVPSAAAASAAPALHLVNTPSLFAHPSPQTPVTGSKAEDDAADPFKKRTASRAATDSAAVHALPIELSLAYASSSAPAAESALLTLEQLDAFVRRHDHLCRRVFLFSASPTTSASAAAGRTVPPKLHGDGVEDDELVNGAPDGQHRHSPRAIYANEAVVKEIRAMLDRVAQEPHVFSALTDKQRHRWITDVCRIGYVVGLHSRCCALYVDTVLLASRKHRTSTGEGSNFDLQTLAHESSAVNKVSFTSIPEFIIDAAGETADLPTLEHCLAYAAPAVIKPDAVASSPGTTEALEMNSGWLAVLHVFVQCVRVALQHGWHGLQHSAVMEPHLKDESSGVEEGAAVDGKVKRPRGGGGTAEAPLSDARSIEERWHHFTMRVLRLMCIHDDTEAFFKATLRSARYHHVYAGGDWPAAQASVYASCFRCWLGEAGDTRVGTAFPATVGSTAQEQNATEARLSPLVSPSPMVRPTCPALVMLLRTAVAAHQHDIAEWATLYVDMYLDDWTSDGGCNSATASLAAAITPAVSTSRTATTAQLDVLLVWYLRYLKQSNQRPRACCWLHQLRTRQQISPLLSGALQSLPVLRIAARLAGEERNADLALWCLQLCLGDAPGLSPTHHDIFTCLCAYARCGLPTFDMVLQSLQSNGLLSPTVEELLFVRLLHARRSVSWRSEWEQCIAPYVVTAPREREGWGQDHSSATQREASTVTLRLFATVDPGGTGALASSAPSPKTFHEHCVKEPEDSCALAHHNDTPTVGEGASVAPSATAIFSTRVIYEMLLLLQEGEHPDFMSYYRAFLITFNACVTVNDRARWAILALSWASLQHGWAPLEDVVYVVREVEQLMGLQEDHLSLRCESKGNAAASRPLPIAADLYRSLERRWASLYQQYPPSWWATLCPEKARSTYAGSAGEAVLLDPVVFEKMAAKARAFAATTIPVFGRCVKKRHRLPTAEFSASEMLLSSVGCSASKSDGEFPHQQAETLHQMDRELWAAYVATVKRI
ncbi:hypothetical protein ABL78_7741 [Leptomonas seymouri]|uniref:Uncharacterized protein n=1 Tax=Leptomonas seymouri TaxID=5684 RepID=A0A0N1HS01_LEPSE|nr:hypothetical protein ABL78_7741 [Leptomonas seymouri]|eukprot:KPI83238.1 hypothetical protein ABL78_7741 [Leptomonas seymouri]